MNKNKANFIKRTTFFLITFLLSLSFEFLLKDHLKEKNFYLILKFLILYNTINYF